MTQPLIVGIGGTTRPGSSSERALALALAHAEQHGARTETFTAATLDLPMYAPENPDRTDDARRLIEALRAASGVIVASPGYHGGISGMIKNILDYTEDMRVDPHPYLDGRAVGLISCAAGWQGASTTLNALRSVVHALRGWPAPLGVAINSVSAPLHSKSGEIINEPAAQQLAEMSRQVVEFAEASVAHQLAIAN